MTWTERLLNALEVPPTEAEWCAMARDAADPHTCLVAEAAVRLHLLHPQSNSDRLLGRPRMPDYTGMMLKLQGQTRTPDIGGTFSTFVALGDYHAALDLCIQVTDFIGRELKDNWVKR